MVIIYFIIGRVLYQERAMEYKQGFTGLRFYILLIEGIKLVSISEKEDTTTVL